MISLKMFYFVLASIVTHANLHHNVHGKNVNFAVFGQIFIKLLPKCRTKKMGMIYTIFWSFCSFFNWEGLIFIPKSGLGSFLYNVI